MARLLVTGGAGFIGTNFLYYHARHYPADTLVVLDALTYAGRLENIEPLIASGAITFVQGNILDTELVISLVQQYSLDTIVNFAAHTHVDRSISGPDDFILNNTQGTYSLLKAALHCYTGPAALTREDGSPGRFHQISTDEVYGMLGPEDAPFTEEHSFAPNSPYSASKAAADLFVRAFVSTYGLNATVTHCSNNYGPYQFPEKFLPVIINSLLQGRDIPVYGDGRQVRDWLFVDDHAAAIETVLHKGISGERYNVGGNCEKTNLQLIECTGKVMEEIFAARPELKECFPHAPFARPSYRSGDFRELVRHVQDRLGHDRRYAINAAKIQALGFAPAVSFLRGLRATVLWYIEREFAG